MRYINPILAVASLTGLLAWAGPASAQGGADVTTTFSLRFSPDEVTIQVNEEVRWRNLMSLHHNVLQVSRETWDANDATPLPGGFRSGDAGERDTFSHTFTEPGTFYYVCEPHVNFGMKGVVHVMPVGGEGEGEGGAEGEGEGEGGAEGEGEGGGPACFSAGVGVGAGVDPNGFFEWAFLGLALSAAMSTTRKRVSG